MLQGLCCGPCRDNVRVVVLTMDTAMDIAREIASKSPLAIRKVKAGFNVTEEMPERDAYRYEQTIAVELAGSEDTREAQRTFVEKRKPVFTAR